MNKPLNRDSLKALFSNGSRPDGDNFASLIDSMSNKVDDEIGNDTEEGLVVEPDNTGSRRLISFYRDLQEADADWVIRLGENDKPSLSIAEPASDKSVNRLLFAKDGNSGINTDAPKTTFDVNGILGAESRIGTFQLASVPADGKWHTIITGIDDFSIFEIVAQAGDDKSKRHALLHAHVMCRFNKSKIKTTQSYKGFFWNKLVLRFRDEYDPGLVLQLKSRSRFGPGVNIKYHIIKLWDSGINALYS